MAKNIILNKPDLRKARKRLTTEIETIIYEENPKKPVTVYEDEDIILAKKINKKGVDSDA